MADMKTLGIVLIIAGLLSLLFFTPLGSSIGDSLPDALQKKGAQVTCDVNVDGGTFPSLNSVSCNTVTDACRPIAFLGLFSQDASLELHHAGVKVASESFEVSSFGNNKDVELSGCVPNEATAVRIDYKGEEGIIDSKVVNI